jgi:hypothetical protein
VRLIAETAGYSESSGNAAHDDPVGTKAIQRGIGKRDLPAIRLIIAGNQIKDRRFTSPVWPNQPDNRALFQQ